MEILCRLRENLERQNMMTYQDTRWDYWYYWCYVVFVFAIFLLHWFKVCTVTCDMYRVMGPVSAQPLVSAAWGGRMWGVWLLLLHDAATGMGVGCSQGTTPGVGKYSLMSEKAGAGLEVPGPATRLGPWGSQTLRQPSATRSRRIAENRVEDCGLCVAQGRGWGGLGDDEELCLVPQGQSLAWWEADLVDVMAGSAERPYTRD